MDIENVQATTVSSSFASCCPRASLPSWRPSSIATSAQVVPTLSEQDAFYQDRSRPETLKQLQRMGRDSFFDAYRDHPRWRQVAETLLGEPADAEEPEWFNKPPGTVHVTPPHQDNYYFCLTPPHVLTIWLALDDVDAENGCLRYVAGSHTRGFRPHDRSNVLGFSQGITDYSPDDSAGEVAVSLRAGDAVGAPRHDDSPGRRQSFAVAASPVVCHGLQGSFLPPRRRGVCQVHRLGPTTAPGVGPDHLRRRRPPACRKRNNDGESQASCTDRGRRFDRRTAPPLLPGDGPCDRVVCGDRARRCVRQLPSDTACPALLRWTKRWQNIDESHRGQCLAVVATPAPLHVAQATTLVSAGWHVLIEKPLSTSIDGCARLAELCARAQCRGGGGLCLSLRFRPWRPCARRLPAAALAGRWNWWPCVVRTFPPTARRIAIRTTSTARPVAERSRMR